MVGIAQLSFFHPRRPAAYSIGLDVLAARRLVGQLQLFLQLLVQLLFGREVLGQLNRQVGMVLDKLPVNLVSVPNTPQQTQSLLLLRPSLLRLFHLPVQLQVVVLRVRHLFPVNNHRHGIALISFSGKTPTQPCRPAHFLSILASTGESASLLPIFCSTDLSPHAVDHPISRSPDLPISRSPDLPITRSPDLPITRSPSPAPLG